MADNGMPGEAPSLSVPTAGKIKAQAQQPTFVYQLVYRNPIFDFGTLDDAAVGAAFESFRPWNVSLDNVKVKEDPANFAEEATEITLLGGRVAFSISPGGCRLVVANVNWSQAEGIIKIAEAGIGAVLSVTGAIPERQLGTITMHLTPESGSIAEMTSKFVKLDMGRFGGGPAQSSGFSVYREDFLCVVDRSAGFPNSLFVRLDRWLPGKAKLEELANQLNADESVLLELLGLDIG